MKNNNLLKNNLVAINSNSNSSFFGKNRNMVVFGIIIVFLIIYGIILYSGILTVESNINYDYNNSDFVLPPVFSNDMEQNGINNINKKKAANVLDSNNVNLLNNVKDQTVDKELDGNKQVYNISNNIFSYQDARAACKAHGGDLATYHQVLDSYKKGGEWCNYGWSEDQMALYPTQKDTWEELQKDSESARACGNWGVNGGYFDNPNTLFGANCYGIKPKPKDREREKQLSFTKGQKIMLDKINMYKNQRNELTVTPFNRNIWSEKGKLN